MIELVWGHKRLVQVQKMENGRLYLGGYAITYDRDGKEVSRSEPTWNCSIGYDDGTPLLEIRP